MEEEIANKVIVYSLVERIVFTGTFLYFNSIYEKYFFLFFMKNIFFLKNKLFYIFEMYFSVK